MKKYNFYPIVIIFMMVAFTLVACKHSTKPEKIYLSSLTTPAKNVKLADSDLRFLVKAYSTGVFKIALANEAQIRSTSAESNQLARAVADFHLSINNQINEIADKHGFTLPIDMTDEQKATWKELIKEKGWAFDKKFADLMENFSEQETSLYQFAVNNTSDKAVTVLAQKAQPGLLLHQSLRATLNEKVSERTTVAIEKDSKTKTKKKSKAATNES